MSIVKSDKNKKLQLVTRTQTQAKKFTPPKPPAELPKSMASEWKQICKNLHDEGLFHEDRLPIVTGYLFNIYLHREAADMINNYGAFDSATGKVNPAQIAGQRALQTAIQCAKSLGLSVTAATIQAGTENKSSTQPAGVWAKSAKGR